MADVNLNDTSGASFIEWVQLDGELEKLRNERNKSDSPQRKSRNTNFYKYVIRPLLVIGTVTTGAALGYGLYSFTKNDRVMQQKMMRLRVFGQFFTIVCFTVGVTSVAWTRNSPSFENKN